jgi:DNA polymerase-1
MRALAMRGGPWSGEQRESLLNYCEADVDALERLLPAMVSGIDLPLALSRGRYMAAVSAMEHAGVPIDVAALGHLRANWEPIQDQLIAVIDADYHVFEGSTFKQDRFEGFLVRAGIPWARLESGRLDLSDDAFREAAKAYPIISPLRELRSFLSEMRPSDLSVGRDGRNRTLLSPFQARSGRNQPSNTKFIFGPSVWLRGLIKPEPGYGLAYVDYSQQEFGVAAALSGDKAMQDAYQSGDPYLAFAKQARGVPEDATKQSHEPQRELFKQCVLGVQYGMGPETLARRIGQPSIVARELLRAHRG